MIRGRLTRHLNFLVRLKLGKQTTGSQKPFKANQSEKHLLEITMDTRMTLLTCTESLIARLETIRETHPDIHLDEDIAYGKKVVANHRNNVLKAMMAED